MTYYVHIHAHTHTLTGTTHNMVSPLNARRGHSSYSHAADSAMEVAENNQQEPHRHVCVPVCERVRAC